MMVPLIIAAFLAGLVVGAVAIGIFAGAESECPTCDNGRIVLHAGDATRDDGFCELKLCPTCRDGSRLGRSDVPIVGPVGSFARGGRIPQGGEVVPIELHRGETLLPPPRPDRPQDN